jgi:DNA-directed RNA polymerase specialized sigma subunit
MIRYRWKLNADLYDPTDLTDKVFKDNMLEETIKLLPSREAIIIRGVLLSNRTQASIARQLRVSNERIRQLKFRAIKHMGEILKELGFAN